MSVPIATARIAEYAANVVEPCRPSEDPFRHRWSRRCCIIVELHCCEDIVDGGMALPKSNSIRLDTVGNCDAGKIQPVLDCLNRLK